MDRMLTLSTNNHMEGGKRARVVIYSTTTYNISHRVVLDLSRSAFIVRGSASTDRDATDASRAIARRGREDTFSERSMNDYRNYVCD